MSAHSSDMPKLLENGVSRSFLTSFIPVRDYSVSNFAQLRNPNAISPIKVGLKSESKAPKPAVFIPRPPKEPKPASLRRPRVLRFSSVVTCQNESPGPEYITLLHPESPDESEASKPAGYAPRRPKEPKPERVESAKVLRLPPIVRPPQEVKTESIKPAVYLEIPITPRSKVRSHGMLPLGGSKGGLTKPPVYMKIPNEIKSKIPRLLLPSLVKPTKDLTPESIKSGHPDRTVPNELKSRIPRLPSLVKPKKDVILESIKAGHLDKPVLNEPKSKIPQLPSLVKPMKDLTPEPIKAPRPVKPILKNKRINSGFGDRKGKLSPIREVVTPDKREIYVHQPRDPWHRKIMEEARERDRKNKEKGLAV